MGKGFCKSMEKDNCDVEMEESHQDAYDSSGDDCDNNEGGCPTPMDSEEENSMNMNSFEEEDKTGLRSPFEQRGNFTEKIFSPNLFAKSCMYAKQASW